MTFSAQRPQFKPTAAIGGYLQANFEICCRKIGLCAIRPLHNTNAVAFEVFFQSSLEKFFCVGEAIKIKVIYDNSRIFIRFDQGICWALHLAGETETA